MILGKESCFILSSTLFLLIKDTISTPHSLTVLSFFPLITGILYLRILFGSRDKVEHTLTVFEVSEEVVLLLEGLTS
jgi:hypothetical protein